MKSKLSQFRKLQNNDVDTILAAMDLDADTLQHLLCSWAGQGSISPRHHVLLNLKKSENRRRQEAKLKKLNEDLETYRRLKEGGRRDRDIYRAFHGRREYVWHLFRKTCLALYKDGVDQTEIATRLQVRQGKVNAILEEYVAKKEYKAKQRDKRHRENEGLAKTHLPRLFTTDDYLIFDIEANAFPSELIEVAMINAQGNVVYNTLVKPSGEINWRIRNITGITNRMVADQPGLHRVMSELTEICQGKTLLSWGNNFDIRVLEDAARQTRTSLDCSFTCAQKIHMGVTDTSEGQALYKVFGAENQSHRALEDCRMVLAVLAADERLLKTGEQPRSPLEKAAISATGVL